MTYEEMLAKQNELTAQLSAIKNQIREYKQTHYEEEVRKAFETLNRVYKECNIYQHIEVYCEECEQYFDVELDTILDKMQGAFEELLRRGI